MSAAGIPQIAVVMGSCTAGGAYVPAMSRREHHRARPGHDLPGRAAAGEGGDRRGRERRRRSAAPRCTARLRRHRSSGRRTTPMRSASRAASSRNLNRVKRAGARRCAPPASAALRPARKSTASCRADARKPYDVREIIARLVDGSEFDEFKPLYGTTLVTGFARILGLSGRHRRQ